METEANPVIDALQDALKKELYAVSQYLSDHEQLEFLGYSKLADEMKDIAIQEMTHAGTLSARIKALLYEPAHAFDIEISKGEDSSSIFKFDAEVEKKAIIEYNEYASLCRTHKDEYSADIFSDLIKDEQRHFDYFNKVYNFIETLGVSYLSTQANAHMSSIKKGS